MSTAAPWEDAPIDFGAAGLMQRPGVGQASGPALPSLDDGADRPLTIRGARGGAASPPAAPPSPLQSAALPADDAPWERAPIDTGGDAPPAGPSWLDTAADMAKSAATGVEKGAIGMATLPVTIAQAAHGLADRFINPALSAILGPAPDQPPADPGSLHDVATNTGDYLGAAGVTRGIEDVAGPMYQPQTTAGKYAETVGEFVPGAAGGGVGGLAKLAVLPGIASEAAGQATQGTPLEPYARAIAPMVAGSAVGLSSGPGAAGQVMRDAAGPLDASTIGAAQTLMNTAQAQGTPLSLAEAVQQVTNSGTRLGSLQRVVEQSRGGADTMARFYADRPAQVQQAGNAAIDRIAPAPAEPVSSVGPGVQQAAESVLGDAHGARTAATSPLYQAAGSDTVPAADMHGILDHLDGQIASDRTGLLAGPLGDLRNRLTAQPARAAVPAQAGTPPTRSPVMGPNGQVIRYQTAPGTPGTPAVLASPRVPITDVENINRTRKYFRDKTALPQFAPDAIDKETGARVGRTLDALDRVMTNASPRYAAANNRYANITQDVVDPLENGMIGALSRSKDFGAQASVILNANPVPGSAREVSDAIRMVRAKSEPAAQALVSQRIRQVFNEATQDNVGGPNQWGGAKFNALIRGNSQQGENLQAAIEALHGQRVWQDFQKTLDVFEAMGRRQAPGSMTEPNRQISRELQKGGKLGDLATAAITPSDWMGKARELYDGFRYGRNTRVLADMLTRPDAATALGAIAKAPAGSSQARGLAAIYMLNTAANQRRKAIAQ